MIKLEITKSRENPFQSQSCRVSAPTIPENWQSLLLESWSTYLKIEINTLTQQLSKHIGPDSTFSLKEKVIQGLKEIYLCLVNQSPKILSEEEKQMLLTSITSEITECSPGFQNRIMDAQQFLQLPCSIEQFMFQIRTEIVDAGARFFSSDVHDHNKIFLWAKSIFGVNVPNEHDPFQNINLSLDLEAVHLFLSEKFDLHYQPLQLLSRVEQKLMDICHKQFAYDGFQRNGYDLTVYTRILNYFIQIFQDQTLSTLDCFMFDSDETKIQDIDWSKIKKNIFMYMIKKQIILCSIQELSVLNDFLNGKKQLDPKFLLLINNEMEFIYFIKLFLDKNPESSIPFFLQYFGSVPSIKAINTCTNFIQLSQQPSVALDILKQINISLPLAPLILQNERQFEGFLFSGINAHQQLSAMLSLLDFLSPPQLSTILRQRDFFQNNILTITIGKPETYFQELIAYIQSRIEPELLYELLSHSDIYNKNALILALETQSNNYKVILSLIKSLDLAQQAKILSKTTSDGFTCLDAAMLCGEEELKCLLQFIYPSQPKLLSILFRRVNVNGKNFLGQAITLYPDKITLLIPYLMKFDQEVLLEILQQNNLEGKHALLLCAKHCPQYLNNLLQLLLKLEIDDAHSILKKLTTTHKSILYVMKKAPYEFVHDLLSFIHQHYPTLLTFILCHQEDDLNHPLFYRIEENQINLENFMEFIRLVPEKYQYELLTCVTKDGFSLLASAVIYERHEQVKVLIVNLIQHYHKDYAEDLVYFFYGQLQKLNQRPKKIKFIFEQLLEDESIEIQHIKQRFLCNLLNVIIAQASKNPSLNFGRVFKRLFQHSPSEKNRLFLSMLFACCMEHTEQQTKLFIDEILNVLNRLSFHKQSHVIPYLFLMFKELRQQFPSIAQSILNHFNVQHEKVKSMFCSYRDEFGDSIVLSSVYRDYGTFFMVMNMIKSLNPKDQFDIMTQTNKFGGNLISNLLIHQTDNPLIKLNLSLYIAEIFSLPVQIQRALMVPDSKNNILGLVIQARPDFFETFITQIKKIDSESEQADKLEHMLMRHYSPRGLSVGLVAAQQKSFDFSIFIKYLKMLDNDLLFEVLNQDETAKPTLGFFQTPSQQKTIFSCLLPKINITSLNELILLTQRLPVEHQQIIIDKSIVEQMESIHPKVLEAFLNYKASLHPDYKRPYQEVELSEHGDDHPSKLTKHL